MPPASTAAHSQKAERVLVVLVRALPKHSRYALDHKHTNRQLYIPLVTKALVSVFGGTRYIGKNSFQVISHPQATHSFIIVALIPLRNTFSHKDLNDIHTQQILIAFSITVTFWPIPKVSLFLLHFQPPSPCSPKTSFPVRPSTVTVKY